MRAVVVGLLLSTIGVVVSTNSAFADAISDCRGFDMVKTLPKDFEEAASALLPRKSGRTDEVFYLENASCECHNRVFRSQDFPGTPDDAIWSCTSLAERDRLAEETLKAK